MRNDIRRGYKILTHDFRSPIQGGAPLWDGITLPWPLPVVPLDTSPAGCAAGWNYCASLAEAIPIVGLWPTGIPSVMVEVEADGAVIQRGTKRRSASLTIVRRCEEAEVLAGIQQFSRVFAPHEAAMGAEQWAWRQALARPAHDEAAVVHGLQEALHVRGLAWTLQRFETPEAARDTRDTWDTWDIFDTWATLDTWDTGVSRAAWDARAVWASRDVWASRAAWAAWDARIALIAYFTRLQGWTSRDAQPLTAGIREAYAAGLGIVFPVEDTVLGWAMEVGSGM